MPRGRKIGVPGLLLSLACWVRSVNQPHRIVQHYLIIRSSSCHTCPWHDQTMAHDHDESIRMNPRLAWNHIQLINHHDQISLWQERGACLLTTGMGIDGVIIPTGQGTRKITGRMMLRRRMWRRSCLVKVMMMVGPWAVTMRAFALIHLHSVCK